MIEKRSAGTGRAFAVRDGAPAAARFAADGEKRSRARSRGVTTDEAGR